MQANICTLSDAIFVGACEPAASFAAELAAAAQVERLDGLQHMRIPAGQQYLSPGSAYVEGDASSASYFLAGATITGNRIALCCCRTPQTCMHWINYMMV